MKYITTTIIFLYIYAINGYAQESLLHNRIQQAKNFGEKFEMVSAFTSVNEESRTAAQDRRIQDNFINSQEVYTLRYDNSVTKNLGPSIILDVPLGSRSLQLELEEFFVHFKYERVAIKFYHQTSPFGIIAVLQNSQYIKPNDPICSYRFICQPN